MAKDARIVVIGAGAAGLSAAQHLIENDFENVIILEATDRIGGRIHSVPFEDGVIELGANWVHGIGEANSMYTLATAHGLVKEPYILLESLKGKWVSEKGLSEDTLEQAMEIYEKIEDDLEEGRIPDETISIKAFMQKRFTEELKRFGDEDKKAMWPVFNAMMTYFGLYAGDDPNLVSANAWEKGDHISDTDVVIPEGYCSLLEKLQDEIPENALKFNRLVTNVIWNNQGKTAAKVVCKFGDKHEEYLADHVIVTCSLGHLKQYHTSLFQPSLPKEKINAIQRMGFGNVGKIFLHYDSPFWVKGTNGFKLALEKFDNQSPDQWHKSIFQFTEVDTCPNTLIGWVIGSGVRHMESLPADQVGRMCTEVLRKFLHNDGIPEPTRVRASSWSSDPLFLGCYCYFSTKALPTDVETISEPLLVGETPVVCFAGEATHAEWFSYTHGARSSGIREAERLIDLY